jgi:hypothetical protein
LRRQSLLSESGESDGEEEKPKSALLKKARQKPVTYELLLSQR